MDDTFPEPQPPGEKQEKHPSLRREILTLTVIAVCALGAALFLRLCVAQAYEIKGVSMAPTYADGDRVILNMLAPSLVPIERGDIVIFRHPSIQGRDLVKRVIGVGGDHVHIERGKVFVNGLRLLPLPGSAPRGPSGDWSVPPDCYFLLGDNALNSMDSRDFGPVPRSLLKGKVWFRWWHAAESP